MYNLSICLLLKGGQEIKGVAIDTVRNDKHQECLLIKSQQQDKTVILDELSSMHAMIDNPHFKDVYF